MVTHSRVLYQLHDLPLPRREPAMEKIIKHIERYFVDRMDGTVP